MVFMLDVHQAQFSIPTGLERQESQHGLVTVHLLLLKVLAADIQTQQITQGVGMERFTMETPAPSK